MCSGREHELKPEEAAMVVHGPEVFDQGDVSVLQRILSPQRTIVAGVMARTAAEESGLLVEYSDAPPSMVIRNLKESVILVNRGKTPESGRIFGEIVSRRLDPGQGLLHLECSSRTLYLWNCPDAELSHMLAARTGFRSVRMQALPDHGSSSRREIRGCLPGEAVCINGLVIGRATAETVVVEIVGDAIQVVSGLLSKPHGLEKLHRTTIGHDPDRLWCKSGKIRSSLPHFHETPHHSGRIAVIDHCGHKIYRILDPSVCGILTIGDDTTSICGHIAAHRGLPLFGIVDGDSDNLVNPVFMPGSVVVQVPEGSDDIVGQELAGRVTSDMVDWDDWVQGMLKYLADRGYVVRIM